MGKIDINGTIAQRMRNNQQIACNYDELSENNTYNQILVTTASMLIRHSDVKKDKKSQLKKLMLFFQQVQLIDIHTIRWNALRFDRNNRNYRMLMYLCYFILDGLLMTTEEGQYKLRDFSDEHMNRLFEKFVLEYYKRHYPDLKPNAAKIGWNVVEQETDASILPIMQTDILLNLNERKLIIDMKYYGRTFQSQYDKKTIHSGNLYQIHTYVTEYDKGHTGKVDGMLLYAKTQESIVPDGQIKMNSGNTIYFRTLDLNQEFKDIEKQLKEIIQI